MRNFASTMLMALVASTLVACGDDSSTPDAATPDASTDASGDAQTPTPVERAIALTAEGITVNITTHPYAVSVADASGTTVLSTLPNARGDGYAPIAWTSGRLSWSPGVITPGHYRFAPSLDPWREGWVTVDVREAANEVTLVMAPPDGSADRIEVTHRVRASTLRVEAKLVTEGDAPRAWEASFAAPTDEHYLGLGERFTRTDQRGLDVYSWAEEGGVGLGENRPAGIHNPSPNGEAMTYYPVPFMISTKGYGFWLDTTWRSEFNLVTAHDDAWRVWEIGPELAFEVYLPKPADTRPWPYQIINLFTEATGRPRVAPAWTYGPRRRIGRGSMQDGVPEIQAMRDRDLAITGLDDAVHFLPAGSCSFSMDGGTKATIWTSSEAMDAWRTYARLHTRLFPYVWALAHEAHATGAPIMRHVFLEHPDRVDLAGVDDAYYYGPAILVAPVVARGDVTKTIDLPAGHYLDWQAETLVEGGSVVTLPAPLDKLPLLLRDGYLVPMLDPTIDTLASAGDASVVTPEDVADVYDVVGLLSTDTGGARFTMADGGALTATYTGAFVAPAGMTEATTEAELTSCSGGCYLVQALGGGLSRVRISHAGGALTAGGLALDSDVGRRVRWDLYLLEP